MFSKRQYSFARAALHGLAVLGLVFAAAVNALPAYAAVLTNDLIEDSVKITAATFTLTIDDVTGATLDVNDPFLSCDSLAGPGDNTVWYTFTPAKSGEVSINTTGSGYDTVLGIFKEDAWAGFPFMTEVGCNNDSSAVVKTSSIVMPLRGGIKYYIEVALDSSAVFPSPPDALKLGYSFVSKSIAWAVPGGTKWNGNASVFTFSSGWQNYTLLGAYRNDIRISNNINNTAVTYFDGEQIEIGYTLGPSMGNLEVIVDGAIVATLGQGAAVYMPGQVWLSGFFSDNVHKLILRHAAGGTKANFDYLTVYPAPDLIPPGEIMDLTATTGTTTGRVTLKWTSTGDDMNVGTAHHYEVRYFLFPIPTDCPTDWATGSSITLNLPKPAISGTLQQVTLSGLAPGIHYDFCIAAWDEAANMGVPSNVDDAIALAGVPYGTGTYDDKNIGWVYTGNWKMVTNTNARYNTLHISSGLDDSALFYFTGNQFVFTYMTGPLGGFVDVYIDEVYYTTIDQFTLFASIRYFTSPILPLAGGPYVPPLPGPHTVRFIHMTGVQMTVDQIYINTTYDLGAPDPIVDLWAVPGANLGEVDLTWTAVGDDPSAIGFPPGDDTANRYEVRYSANGPIFTETDWDYANPAAGVFPAPQAFGNGEAVTVVGLTPGVNYWFAVRVSDDAYYNVMSNTVNSPSADPGFLYQGAGNYEDDDIDLWKYGSWSTVFDGQATTGHIAVAHLSGSSAYFSFNGTGFTLTFQKNIGFGKMDVYVDGIMVGRIDQFNRYGAVWGATWNFPAFAAGNHVVEFRMISANKVTLDMIEILP